MTKKIVAAGGIVQNENGALLLQYRRGKWDLPKGKLDDGETIIQCALREVEEETGLTGLVPGPLVGTTTHNYTEKGNNIEKETHWFLMHANSAQPLVPQTEEDILELRWVQPAGLAPYLADTYPNIVEIIERFYKQHGK